jgi:beta-lactamase superfamily II metal-dependent hydrolase
MEVHFIDVGCGNMTLLVMPEGSIIFYDCNITEENRERVLRYVKSTIGASTVISVFINSHRDADHMRGINLLHVQHTIMAIWDTGVAGTTTDSTEYKAYMDLRRKVTSKEIEARHFWDYGDARLRCMNAKWSDYSDANEQSVVLKVQYKGASVMLAGDTNVRPWKEKILTFYSESDLISSILLASHHGSLTFFDDPSDDKNYYTSHVNKIKPAMTLVSVGQNVHDLPDTKAIELYEKYSSGSSQGNKVFTTEDKGTMKLVLKDDGGWSLSTER